MPGTALKFNAQLAPKAGKPVPLADLLKRLKQLHAELTPMEQDDFDRSSSSIKRVVTELASSNLIGHKDKGVRAYTACCLADILRLFAPDAPYTQKELQTIFEFFVKQLKGLENQESPWWGQYAYLLDNLSTVKSVVLITDLPNGEDLMTDLFRYFFDMAATSSPPRQVEFHMTDILTQLIDESTSIPTELIDILLGQFMRQVSSNGTSATRGQTTLDKNLASAPALAMAKSILAACADRLQRHITQYFAEVIYNTSSTEGEEGPDIDELITTHQLIYQIYLASPTVLLNTVPLLEQELVVENTDIRLLAVNTLGRMAGANTASGQGLPREYPNAWKAWLGRENDKSAQIRQAWTELTPAIIANRTQDVSRQVLELLKKKRVDMDEKVRVAACHVIGELDWKTLSTRVASKALIADLNERVRDRKLSVRTETMRVLGKLWAMGYPEVEQRSTLGIELVGWVPQAMFATVFLNDVELNVVLDQVIHSDLLPASSGDDKEIEARVKRMLWLLANLDDKGRTAFWFMVLGKQGQMSKFLGAFIDLSEKWNGGVNPTDESKVLETNLKKVAAVIAKDFAVEAEREKVEADLIRFARFNDRRGYKSLRTCMDPQSDFKAVRSAYKSVLARLKESLASILDTMKMVITRASLLVVNKSIIPSLVDFTRVDSSGLGHVAHAVLKQISTAQPAIYKANVQSLVALIEEAATTVERMERDERATEDTLKAFKQFARQYPAEIPKGRGLTDSLRAFCVKGTSRQAKHATSILLCTERREMHAQWLLDEIVGKLDVDMAGFVPKLSSLSQLMLEASEITNDKADVVTELLIKQVLLVTRKEPLSDEEDVDWVEDEVLDTECQAKVLAVKALVNRARGSVEGEREAVQEMAKPIFKMLGAIVGKMGEISKQGSTPQSYQSRLRLVAAQSMLKFAALKPFEEMIAPNDFNKLALIAQDPCFQVRNGFLGKLMKGLTAVKLPVRFYSIVFLTAHEPEEELREKITGWIKSRAAFYRQQKSVDFLYTFVRLLHLLAHHPDFTNETEDLVDFAKYIAYYLDTVAVSDNVAHLFYFAQRVKQTADATTDSINENLFVISDLAALIIKMKQEAHGWSMQTFPGKLGMPLDLFKALPDSRTAAEIARASYLPARMEEQVTHLTRVRHAKRKVVKPTVAKTPQSKTSTPKKRSSTSKEKKPAKKKAKTTPTPPASSERRRSGRLPASTDVRYQEESENEDEDMKMYAEENEGSEEEEDEEEEESDDA
ncbi:hypothetical protein G7K_2913-t1 [Saitoella complicata NRRL Y-17804]|uniref:Sister chromatid cohesion protein n=2 Tax=Saitoella complicata (strain BCRC 22490 / CBS 7301 / JCM 7358 / NBRC 10748 / NRRL Y-17804) TaxID=698492 RepID=A0A0E9NG05_SAICN|nr:hypothetical protein G7K_2913-t1 [Saitoella complicata NRRL Y-17804]